MTLILKAGKIKSFCIAETDSDDKKGFGEDFNKLIEEKEQDLICLDKAIQFSFSFFNGCLQRTRSFFYFLHSLFNLFFMNNFEGFRITDRLIEANKILMTS
jgi:hypothetical protein